MVSASNPHKTRLNLEVGRIPIALEFSERAIGEVFSKIGAPFLSSQPGTYELRVRRTKENKVKPDSDKLIYSLCRGIYRVSAAEFSLELDLKKKKAALDLHTPWLEPALTTALANLCMFLILQEGGIVLHSCGVVRRNQAYLFPGPSETGKSTVARLSGKATILSQELIGVSSSNRTFQAFALPYCDDQEFSRRSNKGYKIAGLFKLVKDRRNFLKAIPAAQAFADFLILPFAAEHLFSFSDYFEGYRKFVSAVPCYELHFLPDDSFWKEIDAHVN